MYQRYIEAIETVLTAMEDETSCAGNDIGMEFIPIFKSLLRELGKPLDEDSLRSLQSPDVGDVYEEQVNDSRFAEEYLVGVLTLTHASLIGGFNGNYDIPNTYRRVCNALNIITHSTLTLTTPVTIDRPRKDTINV